MERILSIVKPDGIQKHLIGEVIKRFEDHGLKVSLERRVSSDEKTSAFVPS